MCGAAALLLGSAAAGCAVAPTPGAVAVQLVVPTARAVAYPRAVPGAVTTAITAPLAMKAVSSAAVS